MGVKDRPDFGFNEGHQDDMERVMSGKGNGKVKSLGTQDKTTDASTDFYDVTDVLAKSVPTEPDPDSILYKIESVYRKYRRLSGELTVFNIGPGILYARMSHDGVHVSEEVEIYEGETKQYNKVYEIRLRSPTANLRYRVTEYKVTSVSGQTFSGNRFKERRDRAGVILYQDDADSPTFKFEPSFIGTPGTILRSTDFAYSGDFSIRCIPGPIAGNATDIKYRHPDFHIGKVASQIHFSATVVPFTVILFINYHTGSFLYRGGIQIQNPINVVHATLLIEENTPNNFVIKSNQIPIFKAGSSFDSIKLTIDIASLQYVTAVINGTRFDISNLPLVPVTIETVSNHISAEFQNVNTFGTPTPPPVYFDNYIFTEDESLF